MGDSHIVVVVVVEVVAAQWRRLFQPGPVASHSKSLRPLSEEPTPYRPVECPFGTHFCVILHHFSRLRRAILEDRVHGRTCGFKEGMEEEEEY